ncbi:hypothetical protein GCM10009425_25130 [Pseudomonas asuensis]|uniref:Uncharacterized protein n=1 Tax=Pseudomonas asuensis TaxID=1825787 RepID=A0ABQ2GVN9_9PSED|nr:hypothetical protein GCM10009425_25130 [Pseudomonas asuensis]
MPTALMTGARGWIEWHFPTENGLRWNGWRPDMNKWRLNTGGHRPSFTPTRQSVTVTVSEAMPNNASCVSGEHP